MKKVMVIGAMIGACAFLAGCATGPQYLSCYGSNVDQQQGDYQNNGGSENMANSEVASINALAADIQNIYATSNSYKTLTNKLLINAKAVPKKMLNGNTNELVNSFGGLITVAPTKLGSSYAITYNNVPDAECVKISTGVGNNFSEISVNGVKITVPVDPSVASLNCQNQSTSNVIVFVN